MLDFLKEFSKENHDAIFFLPGDKKDQVTIEGVSYKNPGDAVGGSAMGGTYHVILFKEDTKTDTLYNVDRLSDMVRHSIPCDLFIQKEKLSHITE